MITAWRRLMMHRGDVKRPAVIVSETGASRYDTSAPPIKVGVACSVQGGSGRVRQDDQGQVGNRTFSVTFGPECADLRQGDLLIVTSPAAMGTFRLTHVSLSVHGGVNAVNCEAQQYVPSGGD